MEPMPNTLEPATLRLVNRALEVLKEKVKHDDCPRCDVFDWSVDAIAIDTIPIEGVPAHMQSVPAFTDINTTRPA